MREFTLGKKLREWYDNFLGERYRVQDVYAQSTNVDRTKMSLQLVLAGLYPPTKGQIWNPNLLWMPIPTHYVPDEVAITLNFQYCPKCVFENL